jgi:hypothetical protein
MGNETVSERERNGHARTTIYATDTGIQYTGQAITAARAGQWKWGALVLKKNMKLDCYIYKDFPGERKIADGRG